MQITLEWYKYKQYRNGRSKLQINLHILILQMYSIVFKQQVYLFELSDFMIQDMLNCGSNQHLYLPYHQFSVHHLLCN